MKKISPSPRTTFLLHSVVALLLLIVFLVQRSECLLPAAAPEWGCNATRIGDCLADDDEELLMESETSRRFLAGGRGGKPISYVAIKSKKPFCNTDAYGNCIGERNKYNNKRPCDYTRLCRTNA